MGKTGEVTWPGWSSWEPVEGWPAVSPEVLAETLDGGQAFRWRACSEGGWLGGWGGQLVRLQLGPDERVAWSAPLGLAAGMPAALRGYMALESDFAAWSDALPWRSDPHLTRCLVPFAGLRILRQPFGETLLGFLCSATKQIVQIKQMMALLAERHGAVVVPAGPHGTAWHRLPTWAELAMVPEADLRRCLLGFRARYIAETAQFLAAHPGWLEETEASPYPEAQARLCSLPGVGAKVADCVLLFGAGRMQAFPVDVWILRTLARRYGLEGWKPGPLAQFGRVHFGPLAGLAQQYLFAWERRLGATVEAIADRAP